MGQIVTIGEKDCQYQYELPPLPDRPEDIWYYSLPKDQQYWRTPHNTDYRWLDKQGNIHNVKRMSEKDRIAYINYWRDKWLNGLWIMVNGEPTYLTGAHVDHLVFNKFKNRYLEYQDSQRHRFYFRDLTNKDNLCDGRCWTKGRRVGITTEQMTENIRVNISDYSNNTALQSDTHTKATVSLLTPIIDTYIKRPKWMRENFYSSNGKVPRSKLELIDITIDDDKDESDADPALGGYANSFASLPKALDGLEFMLVTMDEFSKWEDVSPYETYEVNKHTIINPGKRGKMDCLSTTGDSKEAVRATRDWHKLIAESNPRIRNANGKTNSGLYVYFVPYIYSWELIELIPEIKDKFGNINREMAEEYIWNEIKKYPKDSKEYVFALYKQPMELRHTLLTATTQTYFSKLRITERLRQLRETPNDLKPYVRGRLIEDSNGIVRFEPDSTGHWLIAIHPYVSADKKIDARNRFRRNKYGVYFPPINPEFSIGYDPIRYRKEDTTSQSLSRASITVHKKWDYFNKPDDEDYVADKRAALYLHRPDDPTDAHLEAIKACKYFGGYCTHERNIEKVKETFEENNMLPFLRLSMKDGKHGVYTDASGRTIKKGVEMLVSRYSPPKEEGQPDHLMEHPFEDALVDLDDFDMGDTHKSDVTMSEMMCEYDLEQNLFTNATDVNPDEMINKILELNPHRN